jgi:hypothetical protein
MATNLFTVSKSQCPQCGNQLEFCSSNANSAPPKVGDISICASCGELLEIAEELKIQRLSSSRLFQIEAESPDTYTALMLNREAIQFLNRQAKGEFN